jgi:hypothetical protein
MFKLLSKSLLAIFIVASPAAALPSFPQTEFPVQGQDFIIKVATASQKAAARRTCRAQYGARLAYVSFRGNQYVCHFRKSNKKLTNEAARNCRKSGMRLARVTSIKIKGNKSITNFVCKR